MPEVAQRDNAPGDAAGYALAYDESVRALEHQERSVDELRSRAGTLLAAASLTTSFLAAAALPKGEAWDWPVWVALGFFALGVVLCLFVLWPRKDWVFVNEASVVIGGYVEGAPPTSIAVTHRYLALTNSKHSKDNDDKMRPLFLAFEVAAASLLVQVIAWLIVLWGGTRP
jgi:hypothetical protein